MIAQHSTPYRLINAPARRAGVGDTLLAFTQAALAAVKRPFEVALAAEATGPRPADGGEQDYWKTLVRGW